MIKPVGALCNLDCTYCYYLPTREGVFDGRQHRMSLRTLEDIFAGGLPQAADHVTVTWQGGEPTLAGLDFFRQAMAFQEKYRRANQRVSNALQTNGTLLDDAWGKFLKEHDFLVGLSVDGPRKFHDHYRVTHKGEASMSQVHRGLRVLQKHGVEFNVLCVLNDRNVHEPDAVLDYLMSLGTDYLQFIPAVEWVREEGQEPRLAEFCPDPEAYGRFMCRVFDLWFEKYCYKLSVRLFDSVLNKLVLGRMTDCVLDKSCHSQLTVEHDGSVFGCDHFVDDRWRLGRIGAEAASDGGCCGSGGGGASASATLTVKGAAVDGAVDAHPNEPGAVAEVAESQEADGRWMGRLDGGRLNEFAARKTDLPAKCEACQWKKYCYGGCPKHRAHNGDLAEPTVLCAAYMMFYEHAMPRLEWMAGYVKRNMLPPAPGMKKRLAMQGK